MMHISLQETIGMQLSHWKNRQTWKTYLFDKQISMASEQTFEIIQNCNHYNAQFLLGCDLKRYRPSYS